MEILTAIADEFDTIIGAATNGAYTETSLRVEHNVIKPDFSGDLYTATLTAEDKSGRSTTKEVSWTVGDLFKNDPSIAREVAQKLADRVLEDYAPVE